MLERSKSSLQVPVDDTDADLADDNEQHPSSDEELQNPLGPMLTWRHPDLHIEKTDYGVTWYELVLHFIAFAGRCMPIWIEIQENQPAARLIFILLKWLYRNQKSVAYGTKPLIFVMWFNILKVHPKSIYIHGIPKRALLQWFVWAFIGA